MHSLLLVYEVEIFFVSLTFLLVFVCFPLFWFVRFAVIFRASDDLAIEKEKKKMLQEEMEATLHDIQNM